MPCSVTAVWKPELNSAVTIKDLGKCLTPSVVAFTDQGERLVGAVAKQQQSVNPKNTVRLQRYLWEFVFGGAGAWRPPVLKNADRYYRKLWAVMHTALQLTAMRRATRTPLYVLLMRQCRLGTVTSQMQLES